MQVRAKKKVTVLAKREADRVTFNLKEGVGSYVGEAWASGHMTDSVWK